MKKSFKSDTILLIIGALLVVTVSAFVAGLIVYPYGILVLLILFIARLSHIKSLKRVDGVRNNPRP